VIERAVIFAESDIIHIGDIGLVGAGAATLIGRNENLQDSLKAYEKEQIYRVLNKHDWDKAEAAKALGIGLSSLYRKIDELEISVRKHKKE
jgi:DNA-binding NtrC family response regulator